MLEAVLLAAAVAAGVTGAWSPCGLSMVETLAPHGYAGSRRATVLACLTFTAGALAGGVATFGGLALVGEALGAGSAAAAAVAGTVALAAAVAEVREARILPQIRRQVPESWRRVLPVTLAAGLYGILLGLGFTTFVLTFAVWALAAIAVGLGDPAAGVLVGSGFGAGRALPVILLAPANGTAWGIDAHAAMAERPGIYRALRRLDAAALAALAIAIGVSPADAAAQTTTVATGATDPSADGSLLAYDRPGRLPLLLRSGERVSLPGRDPAVSGTEVAWRDGDTIVIADAATLREVAREPAPGADAFAFSPAWMVWRAGRRLIARSRLSGGERVLEALRDPSDVGAPSLDADTVSYHLATRTSSAIVSVLLPAGERVVLRRARGAQLLSPVVRGSELLHVRATRARQELRLGSAADPAGERVLYSTTPTARRDAGREPGQGTHRHYGPGGRRFIPRQAERPAAGTAATLWSTALAADAAYVTRVVTRAGRTTSSVLRVPR